MVSGKILSTESMGTMDGPGVRFVLFMQGCPMRCKFCHNPDTWDPSGGKEMTTRELMSKILSGKPYFTNSGGVTFSGGEPFMQPKFLKEMLKKCKENGIHTAVDTCGFYGREGAEKVLECTDLFLLGIKHMDPEKHKWLTGRENSKPLELARFLAEKKKKFWVRYVLIPGTTDSKEDIEKLALFLSDLKSLELVELLPYHKLGLEKWKRLGLGNRLKDIPPPSEEEIRLAKDILEAHGLKTL